jgi:hypothetical protein
LRIVNAFETCCWRRMLNIKLTGRITKDEVFQKAKEERLFLKIKRKNGSYSLIGHIIRNGEFSVNILKGTIFGKKGCRKPSTTMLK